MDEPVSSVQSQYAQGSILESIEAALAKTGLTDQNPTLEDLAPVDGFHIRGREATRELLAGVSLPETPSALDVGCGIGGTARYVANAYGAHVLGVDLSEEYCQVARELTRWVELDDRIEFRQGNALDLPAKRDTFDLVISEHVQMNVSNKRGYLQEMARVLRPGGVLALYEIFAGPEDERHFPVPWADGPSVSFLATPDAFRTTLENVGLDLLEWTDCTDEGQAWFEKKLDKVKRDGPPPVGIHLLMGSGAKEKMKNVARNLAEHRIVIASATARKQV